MSSSSTRRSRRAASRLEPGNRSITARRAGRAESEQQRRLTLTKVLRGTGLADPATVHGFRTSFRTWASERTRVPHAV